MRVEKEAGLGIAEGVDGEALDQINQLSRRKLTEEEIYTFSVRLCDNEVDRDGERFPAETLAELAPLFEGKSGVFDHQWSAKGQMARIYRTELVSEDQIRTRAGDGYCYLKGYAYMLRTEGNRELIAEIEGGIKKEVSVGCAVRRAVCSICGEEMGEGGHCPHVKGREYDGRLCFAELREATDAYEWSFVAVPAQTRAGVMKQFAGGGGLRTLVKGNAVLSDELDRLEAEAGMGRRYLGILRDEVARLSGMADPGLPCTVRNSIVEKLEEGELLGLKKAYEVQLEARYPAGTQLAYPPAQDGICEGRDGAFMI